MSNNDRRKQILRAAQGILASKGIENSSISEIAKTAGVIDSIIYHYFKNKEDLLFYALADKMSEIKKELFLHLEGILDPVSKLSKMIWYHLYLNDLTPLETRVLKGLLFECRSNKKFYTHEGYKTLRDYTKIMSDILKQGVAEKVFRSDINVILVRNMIFGLLDEESLNCFSSGEIKETLPDFSAIMDLVLAIISTEGSSSQEVLNDENKKVRILKAAVNIFAEKGYFATTMSEIANAANVAEGTIYTYFQNKSDLLFSIPKKRFEWLKNSIDEVFEIKNPVRKLRRFIRLHFSTFMGDRDFLKVFLLDIKLNKKFYVSSAYKDYLDYNFLFESILEEGKKAGVFRKEVDKRLFRNLFLGAFTHLTTRWVILEKDKPIDMMQGIEEVVYLLCRAIMVDKSQLSTLS